MIFWMSLVLNRTVAVAFKYLKRVKHKSDILSGLNIMQPAKKKNEETRKSVTISRPNLHDFKAGNWHKFQMCAAGKVYSCLHIKLLDIDNPLAFEVSKLRPMP